MMTTAITCVRHEPGLHHVLTTLKTPEGARAVIDNEGIGHRGWRMIRRPSGALLDGGTGWRRNLASECVT